VANFQHQGLVMENVSSSTVISFPKSKKRGPKVRKGPVAAIITMPTLDRALAAIHEAESSVEQLKAMMSYADLKYGHDRANLPPPVEFAKEIFHGRVTP
jgi:hypothetical protein